MQQLDVLPDGRAVVVKFGEQVIYALQPKQLEAVALTPLLREPWEPYPTHIGYGGAAGGGKSLVARVIAVLVAMLWPGSTAIIFRRTFPEIRDNHIAKFRQEVPEVLDGQRFYRFNAQDGVAEWFNDSRTLFGYLQYDSDVTRYQGNEYDCMIFEESTHYSWYRINWLTGMRLRSSIEGTRPFAFYPSNPGDIGHFWYRRWFIDRRYQDDENPADYAFLQARVQDNEQLLGRDPRYLERLQKLNEPYRSWYLDGNWNAGAGQVLDLTYEHHLLTPARMFDIPKHWRLFGGYDWGFAHPFSFGLYTADEHGTVYKLDTITGRRMHEEDVVRRVNYRLFGTEEPAGLEEVQRYGLPFLKNVEQKRPLAVWAGHDCWADHKSKVENLPTVAERFAGMGWPQLQRASISRIAGLQNFKDYVRLDSDTGQPKLFLFDTPGNRQCFEQCAAMVADPDDMEDALKVDADEYGQGGDDLYDETRYALASRPLKAKVQPKKVEGEEHRDSGFETLVERLKKAQQRNRRAPLQ